MKSRRVRKKDQFCYQVTLRQVLNDYLKLRHLRPNTGKDYAMRVNNYLSDWLDLPIAEISSDLIVTRYQELSKTGRKRGSGEATASVTMRVLRALLNFAQHKYRDKKGLSLLVANPVKILSDLRLWNRTKRRQSVIRPHQIKPWFDAVMKIRDSSVRDYLLFLLLTGTRRGEAAKLRWDDVDFGAGIVTFLDTKNHDDFVLPLSDYLIQLLRQRHKFASKDNPYVFPGKASGKSLNLYLKTNLRISKESGVTFMLHDLRRTFISVADKLDIPYYALKRLLNHRIANDVTAGYIVHDVERLRKPMQMITDYVLQAAQQGSVVAEKNKQVNGLTLPELEILVTTMREFKDFPGYLRRLSVFPLRPIQSEKQHQMAKQVYRQSVTGESLTEDERDYFQALLILITAYEQEQRTNLMQMAPKDVLKRLMKERGLTQDDLAKIMVSKSTLSEFLSGKHMLRTKNVAKLADGLGVDPELFIRKR